MATVLLAGDRGGACLDGGCVDVKRCFSLGAFELSKAAARIGRDCCRHSHSAGSCARGRDVIERFELGYPTAAQPLPRPMPLRTATSPLGRCDNEQGYSLSNSHTRARAVGPMWEEYSTFSLVPRDPEPQNR